MKNTRICRTCRMEKPADLFWPSSKGGRQSECKSCMKKRNSKWCSDNRTAEQNTAAVTRSRLQNPFRQVLRSAKSRSKKKGMPFDLVVADILPVPTHCPVLGIALEWTAGTGRGVSDGTPSLERINLSLGYVRGNVIIISYRANALRRDASLGELRLMVKFYEHLSRQGHDISGKGRVQPAVVHRDADVPLPGVQPPAEKEIDQVPVGQI